jgi:hypothetical protein
MALIQCPDCGKEVSDMANACGNCGRPILTTTELVRKRALTTKHMFWKNFPVILIVILSFAFIWSLISGKWLGVAVYGAIVYFLWSKYFDKSYRSSAPDESPTSYFPYKLKVRTMNESEQALYINLSKNLGNEFIILSKVRIEDFIDVKYGKLTEKERFGLRGKIKSRHVDFLVCDIATTKPLLAIELDGLSHVKNERIERDKFVNELYKKIGLPIRHILVGSNFSEEAIKIRRDLIKK